jgi:hypothetical protein
MHYGVININIIWKHLQVELEKKIHDMILIINTYACYRHGELVERVGCIYECSS